GRRNWPDGNRTALGLGRSVRVAGSQRSFRHGAAGGAGEWSAGGGWRHGRRQRDSGTWGNRSSRPTERCAGLCPGGAQSARRPPPPRCLGRSRAAPCQGRARYLLSRSSPECGDRCGIAGKPGKLGPDEFMTGSVLVYVQHLLGIGHLRRSLRISEALVREGLRVTLISGGEPISSLACTSAESII